MDMRVSGALSAYNTYLTRSQAAPAVKDRGRQSGDTVSLSAAGNEFNLARRAVMELPDVRTAYVSRLQAQLQAGTYQVDSADVAAKIFAAAE